MALKHDEQGFLVGELIEVDKTSFGKAMAIWGDMRRDVSAIRNTLTGKIERAIKEQVAATPRIGREVARVLNESKPSRQRDAKGRFVATAKAATPSRSREATDVQPAAIKALTQAAEKKATTPSETRKTAIALARDVAREANGKFAKKNETQEEKAAREAEEKAADAKAARSERWGRAKDGMKEAAAGAVDTAEALDPAVAATKEMANVAAPLVKAGGLVMKGGLAGIKGVGKSAWGATKWVGRRFGIGADKEGKEHVSWYRRMWRELRDLNKKEGGGGRGLLGMLGAALAGLPSLLSKAVSGLLPKFLKNGLGAIPGMLGGAGRLLGKVLPIAAAGASLFSSWESFNTSTDDYRKRFGAENENSGFWEDLGVRTVGVLSDQIKTFTGHMFDGVIDDWSKQTIKFFGSLEDKLVEKWESAKSWASENIVNPVSDAAKSAGEWVLGKTSGFWESGKKGAGAVSSGIGDAGGVSYGKYQLSTNRGTVSDFLSKTKYGKQFDGLKPGTKAFSDKWQQIAATDAGFEQAQHGYIQSTLYDPTVEQLKRRLPGKVDISKRGNGVKDMIWSTATQYGGLATGVINAALKGKDIAKMSDAEIISSVQQYKLANVDTHFKSSSPEMRDGIKKRITGETAMLHSIGNVPPARTAVAVGGAASVPGGMNVPAHPPLPAQQPVAATTQLNKPAPIVVQVQGAGGAGRGPSDPAIANIANGGTYRTGHNG